MFLHASPPIVISFSLVQSNVYYLFIYYLYDIIYYKGHIHYSIFDTADS